MVNLLRGVKKFSIVDKALGYPRNRAIPDSLPRTQLTISPSFYYWTQHE